jgi:hypothetical protein
MASRILANMPGGRSNPGCVTLSHDFQFLIEAGNSWVRPTAA